MNRTFVVRAVRDGFPVEGVYNQLVARGGMRAQQGGPVWTVRICASFSGIWSKASTNTSNPR